jgi:hypothetical protein
MNFVAFPVLKSIQRISDNFQIDSENIGYFLKVISLILRSFPPVLTFFTNKSHQVGVLQNVSPKRNYYRKFQLTSGYLKVSTQLIKTASYSSIC